MGQHTICIMTERDRAQAAHWVNIAPIGTYVRYKTNKRSREQNSRMWVLLGAISKQVVWLGNGYVNVNDVGENAINYVQRFYDDDWKDYFGHLLNREARWMPLEDGGMIPLTVRTSEMEKQEHSDLTALIEAFGAKFNVDFGVNPNAPEMVARKQTAA